MRTEDIIRAWKDEAFRQSLDTNQQARLPEHPVGLIELHDEDLAEAAGGVTFVWCLIVSYTVTSAIVSELYCEDIQGP